VTVEIGHFALVLALGIALIQASVPMIGAARNQVSLMEVGRTAALASSCSWRCRSAA
jgi:cytochrome c-type biogenesis protein CcmF